MNPRLTAILAVIAIVLVGGLYYYDVVREKPDESESTAPGAPVALWDLKATDVTGLKVTDNAGKSVEVARDGGAWKIVAPSQEPADSARVDTVVSQLATAKSTRKIESKDVNAVDFGLDKPAFVITLTTTGGNRSLTIGGPTFDKTSYYVQKDGDTAAYLVSNLTIDSATGFVANPPQQPTPEPALTLLPEDTATPAGGTPGSGTPSSGTPAIGLPLGVTPAAPKATP
jgi:hypothetical protein